MSRRFAISGLLRAALLGLGMALAAAPAMAQTAAVQTPDDNPESCSGPGAGGPDALVRTLQKQPSCQAALKKLRGCLWGASPDTGFSAIVVGRCEQDFLGKLTPAGKKTYAARMQQCAYEYSFQQGTMYLSAASFCQAEIAASYAADPKLADKPFGPASFDCGKAQTKLEKTICADADAGRADLALADVYGVAIKGLKGDGRAALVADQKTWMSGVAQACHPDGTAAKPAAACVRHAFEQRFTAIMSCNDGEGATPDCLAGQQDTSDDGDQPAERASFDCGNPSTPMEIVICADADLGKRDIALAQAYKQTLDASASDAAARKVIVDSQRNWLKFVAATCPLGPVGGIPPVLARDCVSSAFDVRISQYQACPGVPQDKRTACFNDFSILPKKGDGAQ